MVLLFIFFYECYWYFCFVCGRGCDLWLRFLKSMLFLLFMEFVILVVGNLSLSWWLKSIMIMLRWFFFVLVGLICCCFFCFGYVDLLCVVLLVCCDLLGMEIIRWFVLILLCIVLGFLLLFMFFVYLGEVMVLWLIIWFFVVVFCDRIFVGKNCLRMGVWSGWLMSVGFMIRCWLLVNIWWWV